MEMDIKSGVGYPASALSNFASHRFVFDGVECQSFEGWLQSLKFSNPEMQKHVCSLIGFKAKLAGRGKKWWRTRKLYWQGREIDRDSDDYQLLLDCAYDALFQNEGFRRALKASGDAVLTHSIGKTSPKVTVLTQSEFCGRLMRLRAALS
jgi:N-glycosylase/DNA lyase